MTTIRLWMLYLARWFYDQINEPVKSTHTTLEIIRIETNRFLKEKHKS